MDKEDVGCTHNGIPLSLKKKEGNFAICTTWMDLKGIMPSEINPRQISCNFTNMWNL